MQSEIHITNQADDSCCIDIEGTIGLPEEWQFENPEQRVATYEKFSQALLHIKEIAASEVVVNIRSTGGDVNDALLIYEALKALPAHIVTRCYGYTASAATIIAQAASEGAREIAASALYLIHNSVCATEGNAGELEAYTELLQKTDARLSELYASRSGSPKETFTALMSENSGNGRWLSPEEAVAVGLADVIMDAVADKKEPIIQNGGHYWRNLFARFSRQHAEIPRDQNILHFDSGSGSERTDNTPLKSVISLDEGQRQAEPTRTKAKEDPAAYETIRTSNGDAYAADARRIRK
ncbi:MAG: Clp protease ClpP [Alistipes sp.]